MGTIWMAEQREPVRRRVALKIIKLGMDTKQVIARFEAERQALALMEHPHIATVLDAGATETGRPYFVMEYIKGIPILEYCDQEKLDTRARIELFTSVCHAIQHAHQKGIIHRDIKPSNVLVTLHDGVPVPKVIDFGIAKATNSELTTKTLFTEHRQMIGTPAYMSPEQAEMSGLDIEALLEEGFDEMLRTIREDEPHKPSTRVSTLGVTGTRMAQQRRADPKRLSLLLRGDLDWIVMKCLEKDRTRRYETASGLAADLRRHRNDEPVTAGAPSTADKLRKFIKRNRTKVVAASVILAALLIAIVGTSWGLVEKSRARTASIQREFEDEKQAVVEKARLARNADRARSSGPCRQSRSRGGRGRRAADSDPLARVPTSGSRLPGARTLARVGLEQRDRPRLQQRLQVGEDLRPAARHRRDQLRGLALDRVGDGEPDRACGGLQLHRAERRALGLELRLVLVQPADHQAPRRVGLDDLAGVGDATVALHHLPGGSRAPLAFAARAEPVLLHELRVGQRRPELLRRRADVGHVDERRSSHRTAPIVVSGAPAP
jgi:hypothetical protein